MKIYLAGGITGNLKPFWDSILKIYLSGSYSRTFIYEESMKLFLAGIQGKAKDFVFGEFKANILESFYYIKNQPDWVLQRKDFFKSFMLDSGAFTYLNGKINSQPDWDRYVSEYAKFINDNNIDLFIELDIDSIVGLKEVERLRDKLESLTKKKCIPVWHKSRGIDYWHKMTEYYDYVAIGGIVTREIKPKDYPFFSKLLKIAFENNCKVHGLGFTNLEGMKKYKFYSVDSTAWLYGNRGGFIYKFEVPEMIKIQPKNKRLNGRLAAVHNFTEWVKYGMFAEKYL